MTPPKPDAPPGVLAWLGMLESHAHLTRGEREILSTLAAYPRLASYGSVREIARRAGASVGTVTRTAQALRFSGWAALQKEFRAIYLTSLTATEIVQHRANGQERAAYAWLNRDRDNLNAFLNTVDIEQLERVAKLIYTSERSFVVGAGSYHGVGSVLAYSATLHGTDVRLLSGGGEVTSAVAKAHPGQLLIVMSFWRLSETARHVIDAGSERGVPVVVLGDNVTRDVEQRSTEYVRIPSEAIGFSPSLTVALSVVHAIIAQIVALDPERSAGAIAQTEREWHRFHRLSGSTARYP